MKLSSKITLTLIMLLGAVVLFYKTINLLAPPHIPVKNHTYQIIETLETANTPETMTQGLMWRKNLCDNCGMLFFFKHEQIVSIWMRNTPTSLDMIFINRKGIIVAVHENTVPFQEFPVYTAPQKAMYVMEMKAGFVDRENLKAGMQFDIERLKDLSSTPQK
jgi:uncharacterized membrane protein (UPF0127 family)